LTPSHTVLDEALCVLHPEVLPVRNRDGFVADLVW